MDIETVIALGRPEKSETYYYMFIRKISIRVTWILTKTNFTPNQVTLASFVFSLLSAAFFMGRTWTHSLIAVFLLNISLVLDCVDGELARVKSLESRNGALLDEFLDRLGYLTVIGAITWVAYQDSPSTHVWLIGFAALGGPFFVRIIGMQVSQLKQIKEGPVDAKTMKPDTKLKKLFISGGDIHILLITIFAIFDHLLLGLILIALSSFFDSVLRFATNFRQFRLSDRHANPDVDYPQPS